MKHNVALLISCIFTLLLATVAQASEFSGNTCNEEGANCQTQADWMIGWCEAATAAGAVDKTIEECTQSVGANHPMYQVPSTQNQNAQSSASSSNKSGRDGKSRGDNQNKDQATLKRSPNTSSSVKSGSGTPKQGSDKTSNQWVRCGSWRVNRNDPGRSECVNPAPSGSLPKDYSEKENPTSGGTPR